MKKKPVQGAQLQTTKKKPMYIHKTIHLDRQSYEPANTHSYAGTHTYAQTHARAHTQLLQIAVLGEYAGIEMVSL